MQWNKWIIEQLPIRMRNIRMFALLRVLCSQVTNRYGAFSGFSKEQLGKLDIIPNPETLKQLVFEGSKARITIEEGNGLPYDFTVINSTVDGTLDLRLVDSILRKYKQAGKSFKYDETIIEAKSEWTDYVCEMEYVTSSFTKYVCEMRLLNVCEIYIIPQGVVGNYPPFCGMTIESVKAVCSDVFIRFDYPIRGSSSMASMVMKIEKGTSGPNLVYFNHLFDEFTCTLLSVSDDVYEYKINYEYVYQYGISTSD